MRDAQTPSISSIIHPVLSIIKRGGRGEGGKGVNTAVVYSSNGTTSCVFNTRRPYIADVGQFTSRPCSSWERCLPFRPNALWGVVVDVKVSGWFLNAEYSKDVQ